MRATYEDVLNAPENKVAEILDDELFLSPMRPPRHGVAHIRLLCAIGGPFAEGVGGPGGWWILTGPELHFGRQVLVPDLAGWQRVRLPTIPDEAYFTLPPDWVCEVLTPSTRKIDRGRKLRIYAEAGVAHAWLLDPIDRTLEVLRLEEGAWSIVGVWVDSDVVNIHPFEAIQIELGRLWPDAPAPVSPPAPPDAG